MSLLREWPLVIFTLTVQLAVGLHIALLAARGLLRAGEPVVQGSEAPDPDDGSSPPLKDTRPSASQAGAADPWGRRPSLLVGMLMAVALAVSLLHLGTPLNAVHTLANLDHSWLSREIMLALLFLGLWGLGFWVGKRPGVASWKLRALAWATALVGITLIWVMARIYMVPARPLWDHWLTAASFALTALLLGAAALAAYVEHDPGLRSVSSVPTFLPGAALLAGGLAAILAQVAVTLAHPVTLELMGSPAGTSMAGVRLLLLLGGAFLFVVPLLKHRLSGVSPSGVGKPGRWAAAALLLLGASEAVGRMLFYAVGTVDPF